jgi:hypothetical protein
VDGCRTATIVYDATYAIPSPGFTVREIVSVTYTYKHGRWLSVIDQSTELPADAPATETQPTAGGGGQRSRAADWELRDGREHP